MKPKLLIVEDEEHLRKLVALKLNKSGYEVQQAASIAEAKTILTYFVPDGMVLDINLPDGLGYQVIPDARDQNPEVCVVAISAHHSDAERAVASQAGVDTFLGKPFQLATLTNSLSQLIGNP